MVFLSHDGKINTVPLLLTLRMLPCAFMNVFLFRPGITYCCLSQSKEGEFFSNIICLCQSMWTPNIHAPISSLVMEPTPRECYKFSAGAHAGDEQNGDISCHPVLMLSQFLTCNQQGAVRDHSLICPLATGELHPSSAHQGPASSEQDLRVIWLIRVVWLPLLLATTMVASFPKAASDPHAMTCLLPFQWALFSRLCCLTVKPGSLHPAGGHPTASC